MISVVIPAFDNAVETLTCINSLRTFSDNPFECLVQDDASPHVNLCAVVPPEIASTERNAVNLGFAGNCNAGAARAHLPILMFVNQDVFAVEQFSKGWDTAIKRAFDDPTVGIVGARLLFPDAAVQSVGGVIDGALQPVHRCLGWRNLNHPDISEAHDVTWVTGAALAIRKSVFEALGGFDTVYERGYFEDADLCLRAREAGWKVRYTPACTLVHPVGTTGGSPNFLHNALTFKARWADTGRIAPDVHSVQVRYW
jgi:O-antigen biosynthesis protein